MKRANWVLALCAVCGIILAGTAAAVETYWELDGNAAAGWLGTTNANPVTLKVNNTVGWRLLKSTGTPNVVGGYSGNTVSAIEGAMIGGGGYGTNPNKVTGAFGTVAGGVKNIAGDRAAIGGGTSNTASGIRSAIGGGYNNLASGSYAAVGGGWLNQATADYATVSGGGPLDPYSPWPINNRAVDEYCTVGGGGGNLAGSPDPDPPYARYATVGGGGANWAGTEYATVGGGQGNNAFGSSATVGGGWANWAGAEYATVAGGSSNTSSGSSATVGGGAGNSAWDFATVGGGGNNAASGFSATVGGGENNTASGQCATVGGGESNAASSYCATVGGGINNSASAYHATVPGGAYCLAGGDYSLAAGNHARTTTAGTFVWADSTNADFDFNVANAFGVRATGGATFFSNSALSTGVSLAAGGGSWTSVSDRNVKDNVSPVVPEAVLDKVAALPISTWNYESQDPSIRHMGPMAQDMYAAFGLGESDTGIDTIDADGVALAAIQGLNQRLAAQNQRLAAQNDEIERLNQRLAEMQCLKNEVAELKALVKTVAQVH